MLQKKTFKPTANYNKALPPQNLIQFSVFLVFQQIQLDFEFNFIYWLILWILFLVFVYGIICFFVKKILMTFEEDLCVNVFDEM